MLLPFPPPGRLTSTSERRPERTPDTSRSSPRTRPERGPERWSCPSRGPSPLQQSSPAGGPAASRPQRPSCSPSPWSRGSLAGCGPTALARTAPSSRDRAIQAPDSSTGVRRPAGADALEVPTWPATLRLTAADGGCAPPWGAFPRRGRASKQTPGASRPRPPGARRRNLLEVPPATLPREPTGLLLPPMRCIAARSARPSASPAAAPQPIVFTARG